MSKLLQRPFVLLVLLCLSLAVASCSGDNSSSPTEIDTRSTIGGGNLPYSWAPMVSPTTETLWGVWGSADEVIAVGNIGTAVHHTGTWVIKPTGTQDDLCDVFTAADSRAFAVGLGGTVLRYAPASTRGTTVAGTWSSMERRTSFNLADVFGFGDGTGVVVGETGTILHYDGSAWAFMDTLTSVNLFGVWGSAPDDLYAVGVGGTIIHYDGDGWSFMNTATPENLSAVWGSSASDVWAVGDNGAIMRFDGANWGLSPSGTTETLGDVWGSSGSDVWAVGSGGTIRHYDGSAWSTVASGTDQNLLGVWGRDGGCEVFAVGANGTILRYGAAPEDADVETWLCHDHPGGLVAPPTYGLRLDDLVGEGDYTFSFDYSDGVETARVTITCDEVLSTIHISGRAYGGRVDGDDWASNERGWITIDFSYTNSVAIFDNCARQPGNDWYVTGASAVNTGTVTLDGWGGNGSYSFIDRADEYGCSFIFDNDWDSKGNEDIANDPNIWSAAGWLQPGTDGSRDWLFTAERSFPPLECE